MSVPRSVSVCRLLLALVLACSGLLLTQPAAHACRCVNQDTEQKAKRADVVFSGVIAAVSGPSGKKDTWTYDVELDRVYKGELTTARVEVTSRGESASCGLGKLPERKRYLFFAAEQGASLRAGTCDGTGRASGALTRQVVKTLGRGEAVSGQADPEQAVFTRMDDADPATLTRVAAPGGALVLVGLLGLVLVRRLGSRA